MGPHHAEVAGEDRLLDEMRLDETQILAVDSRLVVGMGVDEDDGGHSGILAEEACWSTVTVNKETNDWARPVVHWEIEARDPERQKAFYGELFNWKIGDGFIMQIQPGLGGPEPG